MLYPDDDAVVSLGDVLAFFTGAEYPPPLGFDLKPIVRFTSTSTFPLASTCALELTLPTVHFDKPDLFKEKIIMHSATTEGLVCFDIPLVSVHLIGLCTCMLYTLAVYVMELLLLD